MKAKKIMSIIIAFTVVFGTIIGLVVSCCIFGFLETILGLFLLVVGLIIFAFLFLGACYLATIIYSLISGGEEW